MKKSWWKTGRSEKRSAAFRPPWSCPSPALSKSNTWRAKWSWNTCRRGPWPRGFAREAPALGAFYTPTGVGTLIEEGKEKRIIDGREMLLEYALRADYALIRAYCADTLGNLVYRGIMRSFNAIMAMAAKVTIVEVEQVAAAGELDPEIIVTPGIFVDRIVASEGSGQ